MAWMDLESEIQSEFEESQRMTDAILFDVRKHIRVKVFRIQEEVPKPPRRKKTKEDIKKYHQEYWKEWYAANREKQLQYLREYRAKKASLSPKVKASRPMTTAERSRRYRERKKQRKQNEANLGIRPSS